MLTREEADAAVQRGIALLDEKVPYWLDEINLDELELQCSNTCILGQVYGHYVTGLDELQPGDPRVGRKQFALIHGFALLEYAPKADWKLLNETWKSAIIRLCKERSHA